MTSLTTGIVRTGVRKLDLEIPEGMTESISIRFFILPAWPVIRVLELSNLKSFFEELWPMAILLSFKLFTKNSKEGGEYSVSHTHTHKQIMNDSLSL
jgi:hypothetical protein